MYRGTWLAVPLALALATGTWAAQESPPQGPDAGQSETLLTRHRRAFRPGLPDQPGVADRVARTVVRRRFHRTASVFPMQVQRTHRRQRTAAASNGLELAARLGAQHAGPGDCWNLLKRPSFRRVHPWHELQQCAGRIRDFDRKRPGVLLREPERRKVVRILAQTPHDFTRSVPAAGQYSR